MRPTSEGRDASDYFRNDIYSSPVTFVRLWYRSYYPMSTTSLEKLAAGVLCALLLPCAAARAAPRTSPAALAPAADVSLEFDATTRTRALAPVGGKQIPLGPYSLSEPITVQG